mmetsp:Transcript_92045/g.257279  ORF Transcript_92045/g.257279 Transcript_92045/m.257279 type:complete len:285 (+) Transcript_92045:996-1850(+)
MLALAIVKHNILLKRLVICIMNRGAIFSAKCARHGATCPMLARDLDRHEGVGGLRREINLFLLEGEDAGAVFVDNHDGGCFPVAKLERRVGRQFFQINVEGLCVLVALALDDFDLEALLELSGAEVQAANGFLVVFALFRCRVARLVLHGRILLQVALHNDPDLHRPHRLQHGEIRRPKCYNWLVVRTGLSFVFLASQQLHRQLGACHVFALAAAIQHLLPAEHAARGVDTELSTRGSAGGEFILDQSVHLVMRQGPAPAILLLNLHLHLRHLFRGGLRADGPA